MFLKNLSVEDRFTPSLAVQVDTEFDHGVSLDNQAALDDVEQAMQITAMLHNYITQYGVTGPLMLSVDPDGTYLTALGLESYSNFSHVVDKKKDVIRNMFIQQITDNETQAFDDVGGVEGLRELLHNPTFQKFGPMIASFFVPTESFAQRDAAKALKAAKAGGDAKSIAIAQKAFDGVKAGFMKGLLRAVVIGIVAESLIRYGVKVADKIANADRVFGTANQVSGNLNALKSMLDKANILANLKVATDGSDSDTVKKKADDLFEEINKLYKGTASYTMTKGSETGWTSQNIPALAKQFDDIVNNTDGLSKSIDSVIDGTVAAGKNGADKKIEDAINDRNKALIKSLKLIHKVANTTTRVFDDLKKFIDKKGMQDIDKSASSDTSKKEDSAPSEKTES